MDTVDYLKIFAALINIGFGLYPMLMPQSAAKTVNLILDGGRGVVEFRVAYGGFFFGQGLAMLIWNDPLVYQVFGVVWVCGAVSRGLALVFDRNPSLINWTFIAYWLIEWAIAIILLV